MSEEKIVVANDAQTPNAPKVEVNKPHGEFKKNDNHSPKGRGGAIKAPVKDERFEERIVFINRVSKTVKGGRRMKFTALVVVGDKKKKGTYGFGLAKAAEVPDAIKKASEKAKNERNLHTIHLSKGDTIAHEVIGKYGACSVFLKPAPEGTGIIAGGPVRAILELAGVRNVCSKVYGSRAPINIIRATHQGLSSMKSYAKIKELRGKN